MENKVTLKTLTVEGAKYKTLLTKKFENRKNWIEPDIKKITAYIPGTILKVQVKEGQIVEPNVTLVVLEAMKMRNQVSVPFQAKVKKINVIEGQAIPKDHCIIELE